MILRLLAGLLLFAWTALADVSYINSASGGGTASSCSVTHGFTLLENDVVVAIVQRNLAGNTIDDNNGATPFTETLQENSAAVGATARHLFAYRRIGAPASEPAAYSFIWTVAGSVTFACILVQTRGAVTSGAPWEVTPSASTRNASAADGTAVTAPAMTVNTAGSLGIAAELTDGATTLSAYWDNTYTNRQDSGTIRTQVSTKAIAGTGSQSALACTLSAVNDWVGHQFALKPAVTLTPAGIINNPLSY